MALVEARDIVKRFGSLTAVDGISFAVDRAEVVGFLGPNGAGKSTAMKIISGFLEPTSGQAFIEGYDSHTQPIEARRRLGYLPEGAPAYADMSVADFLRFIAGMHGLSKRQSNNRLAELVEPTHRLTSEVWLEPTPGHTPGHASVRISSRGEEAVITGDVMHHPIQIAHPDWVCAFDTDAAVGSQTRRQFVERYCDRPVRVLGTHFGGPSAGHIVRRNGSFQLSA